MSYYSTSYYEEKNFDNSNPKPTLIAPISFLKNQTEEKSQENLTFNRISSIEFVENTNDIDLNNNVSSESIAFNEVISKEIPNMTNNTASNNLKKKKLIGNVKKYNLQNNNSTELVQNNVNSSCNISENTPTKINQYKRFNKITDSSFELFPNSNCKWFGINVEKSNVANFFFNDCKNDVNNSQTSVQLPITSNKFKYISHTNQHCLCLQPKFNSMSKKFQPAYIMQVIKDLDPNNFYELNFWGAKFDYNHFKAEGLANNTSYNLIISAILFWNDVSIPLSNFLENPINWPLTSNNTFLKFSSTPLFQIIIPEGTPNQITLTGSTKYPILSDYQFQFYTHVQNNYYNNDISDKTNEATLVFIAEALDPSNPAGIWCIDDINFL